VSDIGSKYMDFRSNYQRLPRILVVDDDKAVQEMLTTLLSELGMNVVKAVSDGIEAVDFITDHGEDVDLVLLDMVMKKLHGNVALPILKSKKPELKVIIISGFFMDYKTHFLANLGADGFVEKPFTMTDLQQAISKAFPALDKIPAGNDYTSSPLR